MGFGWFLAGLVLGSPESRDFVGEVVFVRRHVVKGGCIKEFDKAMDKCQYARKPDAEACIKATAALRKCFAGNPEWFEDGFLVRMDKGLDQDLTPSQIKDEERRLKYRWWTGMRRS